MYFAAVLPVLSALAAISLAQTINPDDVSIADREQWCTAQKTSCPLLCLQYPGNSATTQENNCDPKTLAFDCVCAKGQVPNATEYSQTIPYFECTVSNDNCVANCDGATQCQYDCRANNPCGATDPTRVKAHPSHSSASQSGTTTAADSTSTASSTDADSTAFATLGASPKQTNNAGSGTNADGTSAASELIHGLGRTWGMVAVLGSVFAGVALAL